MNLGLQNRFVMAFILCAMLHAGAQAQSTDGPQELGSDFRTDSLGCLGLRESHITVFRADQETMEQVLLDSEDWTGKPEAWVRTTLGTADAENIPGHLWYTYRCHSVDGNGTWSLGVHFSEGRVEQLSILVK